MASSLGIKQISLSQTSQLGVVVAAADVDLEQRKRDLQILREALGHEYEKWPLGFEQRMPHSPLYVPQHQIQCLQRLQVALNKALTNIIERWYSDENADFPARMPVEEHEERLLRWIAGPGHKLVPDFKSNQGGWRPDILLEKISNPDGSLTENIRVCEINARFPYNGFFISMMGTNAYAKLGMNGMKRTCDEATVLPALMALFDTSRPLHVVLGNQWPGVDIHMLATKYKAQTGQLVRVIKPSTLRLQPDKASKTGQAIFYALQPGDYSTSSTIERDGEALERVYQVSLELPQAEFKEFSFEMLCQLATCCTNDMRSTFLVHDKRMLAVVLEELDHLVNSHKILSQEEADALRQGITPTFLSRSPTWHSLIDECKADSTVKDRWVLKAIRGGFAQGHIFATDVSNEEWLARLEAARESNSRPGDAAYVLQRRIEQVDYNIIRHDFETVEQFFLVGSYQAINGEYVGCGPWRIGKQVHIRPNEEDKGLVMMSFTN